MISGLMPSWLRTEIVICFESGLSAVITPDTPRFFHSAISWHASSNIHCPIATSKPDFSAIEFTVHGSKFPIGDFINAVISFVLIGAAVYFFIVLPGNRLLARMRRGEAAPDPTTKKCPECLSDVPIAARRCAFCTSPIAEPTPRS